MPGSQIILIIYHESIQYSVSKGVSTAFIIPALM